MSRVRKSPALLTKPRIQNQQPAATTRFIHLRFFAGRMSIDEATKKVPRGGWHQPLRTTGRDRRASCVHGFSSRQEDGGNLSADGWRGDQRDLNAGRT